jgi:hypothetical protein
LIGRRLGNHRYFRGDDTEMDELSFEPQLEEAIPIVTVTDAEDGGPTLPVTPATAEGVAEVSAALRLFTTTPTDAPSLPVKYACHVPSHHGLRSLCTCLFVVCVCAALSRLSIRSRSGLIQTGSYLCSIS